MVAMTTEVRGLRELERTMLELGQAPAKKIMVGALTAGAKVIRQQAQANAPVGSRPHKFREKGAVITVAPGNLQKNIKQRIRRGNRATIGNIQVIIPLDGRAFYGKFQEWGWRTRSGKFIAPKQRFLGPAYDSKKDEALAKVASGLGEGIEKEARRIGQENAGQ